MGGLKPIGSEKLEGMDKIRRIMEIARYNENIPTPINEDKSSEYKLSLSDGNTYEIIKERQGYIIKKTLSESVSDYIEPMKNRKYYSSYSQALKKMNLMAREFNQIHGNDAGTSLFEQEGEKKKDTKYVIPVSKKSEVKPTDTTTPTDPTAAPVAPVEAPVAPVAPVAAPVAPVGQQPMEEQGDPALLPAPAPAPVATPDPTAAPAPDPTAPDPTAPTEEVPTSDEDMEPEEDMEMGKEEEVTFKSIQKLTGKLAQKIRTYSEEEEMSSNDTKYIINSILSSLDLTTLEEEDVEDIISRLEGEEEDLEGEEEGLDGEEMDTEGEGMEDEVTEPDAEMGEGYDNFGSAFNDYLGAAYSSKMSDNLMNEFDDEEEEDEYYEYEDKYPKHGSREKMRRYNDEETFEDLFTESKVDKIISKYFAVDKNEKLIKEEKQQQKLKKINEREVYRLSESIKQERASIKFMQENPKAILVGSTVKKNLVFKEGIKEFRVTPNGQVI
jgi:hypothetical protein